MSRVYFCAWSGAPIWAVPNSFNIEIATNVHFWNCTKALNAKYCKMLELPLLLTGFSRYQDKPRFPITLATLFFLHKNSNCQVNKLTKIASIVSRRDTRKRSQKLREKEDYIQKLLLYLSDFLSNYKGNNHGIFNNHPTNFNNN